MLRNKTVFVVGAGASAEVGLPVGHDLKKNISLKLQNPTNNNGSLARHPGDMTLAFDEHARRSRLTGSYYDACGQIVSALPMAISIDNYLHAHRHNEYVTFVGKLAIALCILDAERNSFLYTEIFNRFDHNRITNTWFNALSQMLFEGVFAIELGNVFENISFISFNYDRCIEHYLWIALQDYFNISSQEA